MVNQSKNRNDDDDGGDGDGDDDNNCKHEYNLNYYHFLILYHLTYEQHASYHYSEWIQQLHNHHVYYNNL